MLYRRRINYSSLQNQSPEADFLNSHDSSILFRLAETYLGVAHSFYQNNPVETSQMYLVILRIHQELDILTARKHPLLLDYKSGVTRSTFENLLLPHKKDIELLDEILEYFKARDAKASQNEDVLASFDIKHETFAAAFGRQNPEMIRLKQRILQDIERETQAKYQEVRKTKEYCEERKLNISQCMCDCSYVNYNKQQCEHCSLQEELKRARISVFLYERRLPPEEPWRDAIVFELCIPREISDFRENLAMLKYELMGETPPNTTLVVKTLVSDYRKITGYRNISPSDVVCLGSKCLPVSSTPRAYEKLDVINSERERFTIENELQCAYRYERRQWWPATIRSVRKVCTFRLDHTSNFSPYLALQTNLESTDHTQNQVIARQNECHQTLSLDEFIAFGSLRAGHRIQLRNLYRSISGRILSLDEEPVLALIMQALWQNNQSDAHLDFQDDDFCLEFLDMLEKLVKENEFNYSNPMVLLRAIVIATRIMELNKNVSCQSKSYDLLKTWRNEMIDKWVAKIKVDMNNPEVEAPLRQILFHLRLCSAFSFNVILSMTDNLSNIRNVMRDHDDVLHWLHTIHDLNCVTDISAVSEFSRILFQVAMRNTLTFQLAEVISPGIPTTTMDYVKEALHSFTKDKWCGASSSIRGEITLQNSASSNNVIQMPYTGPTGNSYMVTFDLIVGTFLVNGYSQSQLPPEVAADTLFQRFFKEGTKLMVQRDLISETRTTVEFHGKFYVFTSGHLNNSHAILVKEIQEDNSIWIMLDFTKFRGFVPEYFIDNYTHWLDPENGAVHFRRLPRTSTSADYKRPPDFALKKTDLWKLLDNSTRNPVLNFTSPGFQKICKALLPFETSKFMDALVDTKDANNLSVTAHLRRHNLKFRLNLNSKSLESVEYPGFHLSSDQTSKSRGTLIGLQKGVILENQQTKKRFFIVPHGDIKVNSGHTSGHHQNVSINLATLRQPSFFLYEYDAVLKRVKAVSKSKSAWLYLAALHGATSSPQPDPFTRVTGTEMAMRILQTAFVWSCSPYDGESLSTLRFIRGLAPKRDYYGSDESTESTEWLEAIPSLAAYDGLAMVVDKLLEDSLKLGKLFGTSSAAAETGAKNFLQVRGYLRSQGFHNSAAYLQPAYRSKRLEIVIQNIDNQKSFHHPEIPMLRSTSKPKISLCSLLHISAARLNLHQFPESVQISTNVREFIVQPKNLHAAYPLIEGSIELGSLDTLFSLELRSSWLKLYVWAKSIKTPEEELNFSLLLSAMAYRGEPLEQINTLHYISTLAKISEENEIFPEVPSPHQSYTNPAANNCNVSEVQAILERYSRKYQSWDDDREYYYQLKITSDCSKIANYIKSKWPCDKLPDDITLELETLAGFNFQLSYYWNAQSRNEINQNLQIWFENLKLYLFVWRLDQVLDQYLKGDETIRKPMNTPKLPECDTVATLSEYREPVAVKVDDILRKQNSHYPKILDDGRGDDDDLIFQRRQMLALMRQHIKLITKPEAATPQVKIGLMVGIGPRSGPVSLVKILTSSVEVSKTVKSYARTLGVLCTKLKRLNRCIAIRTTPGFFPESPEYQREMQNPGHKNWRPADHPEWLLLELELDIMIRPVQIEVAQQMMSMPANNGNGVMQLNMGEGKTSVIVPMLCATLASATKGSLCRVTVLSSMYNMNLGILSFAIGGLLDRRVYTVPCRRDMNIDAACVDSIQKAYEECCAMKGVVLTLPEYRLSFRLLAYDKMYKNNFALGLKLHSVEDWLRDHARDILDESDELLGVKYQLVYTMGMQVPIDGGDLRWTVCQKLLHIVQKLAPQLLRRYGSSMMEFDASKGEQCPHIFTSVRLLHHKMDSNSSQNVDTFFMEFMTSVANEMLNDFLLTEAQKQNTMKFLVEEEISKEVHASVLKMFEAVPEQLEKILIISGYLRRGILALALGKRWRVEFGVNPKGQRLMAVPFKAKDVAAEKTEFGHPDLAIVLTHLSYYYSGLTAAQLAEAFGLLRGKRDSDSTYNSWISSIPDHLVDPSLKNYRNLNFKDVDQRSKLFDLLSHHKTIIDYWLSHKVFPKESKQFPGKLVMTSWDLCYDRNQFPVCGFSGTNDSKMLLPLQITQQDLSQLRDTNAKVEKTLLQPENGGHRGFAMGFSCRQMLEQMKEDELTVLIDAGALMLECNNEQLADLWLEVNPDLEAVVYFNDNELLVKTRSAGDFGSNSKRGNLRRSKVNNTQKDTPFDLSPLQGSLEKCGVFLDDQHTRGTDLKFPLGSRACVTIGSRMKRDKLIQACMRMRKLGSGHSVTFYLTHEVTDKIYGSLEHKIETKGILDWVTGNTEEFKQEGLLYWAIAGKNYAQRLAAEDNFSLSTSGSRSNILASQSVDDEIIQLRNLYGQFTELGYLWQLVPHWFQTAKEKLTRKNENIPLAPEVIERFDSIGESIKSKIFKVVPRRKQLFTSDGGMMEEEQEKELEYEQEIEEQEERQVERPLKMDPAVHHLHPNVVDAIQGKPKAGFRVVDGIHRLPDIFKDTTFWSEVQQEGWNGEVFATMDFINTFINRYNKHFDSFLRPLEFLASTFESETGKSQLLLLSPFEVNEMMPWFRNGQAKCRLHLFSTRRADKENILINKARLQLPQVTSDPQGLSSTGGFLEPDTSPSIAALLLASGSLYFKNTVEQKSFARFLSLVPQDWTDDERKLFEQGMILSTTFLLPAGRSGNVELAERSFSRDPTGLVSRILQCRHSVVSELCHVQRLLDDKRNIDIINTPEN